jgi:acetyl esterase/lipase
VTSTDFHPELRRIARLLPREPIRPATLPFIRVLVDLAARGQGRGVETLTLPSGIDLRLHRPVGVRAPAPALLWIHGGGYIMGSARQDDALCRKFARTLGITVVALDYRLAPEHPYPAALEDCYSVLTWLAGLPTVDPERVAFGGGSGGGGLAAALAFWVRDRGDIMPVLQVLAYPMLDDRTSDRFEIDASGHRLWSFNSNRFGWSAYLGDADPAVAVPARHEDLAGLAPTWIGVGSHDLFHDEDLAYAGRLKAAGVPCHLEVVDGAFHVFDLLAPKAGVSQSFFNSQCAALREAFAPAAA